MPNSTRIISAPATFGDTIAAIATASGDAGIAVIRVSGPESLNIADRLLICRGLPPSKRPPSTFIRGVVKSGATVIDEVILLIMRAPHSYTREDVVEFQGHGGVISARRLLRAILDNGARLAEPGEFTRRAFLNGRIDLLQAEAVLDLIRARSDRSALAAIEQLEGRLSNSLVNIYDNILQVSADLEIFLDFSEDDNMTPPWADILRRLRNALADIQALLNTWEEGHVLREGALVVIAGRPNVGKSTLMNSLLGLDRAIVSPIPGTTRDTIEESLVLEGIPIRVVDTAGLRTSDCEIEQEGIRRAKKQFLNADIHLYLIDASQPLHADDRENLQRLNPSCSIIILNKTDLGCMVQNSDISGFTSIPACLIRGHGLREIQQAITSKLGMTAYRSPQALISERHRRLLQYAVNEFDTAMQCLRLEQEDQLVPALSSIRSALEHLGQISGKVYYDELLDSIFSRFCLGK